jgi:hypothetical protein
MDMYESFVGGYRGAFLTTVFFSSTVAYLIGLMVYRLYFSPIAKFPGPKLAALTRWYEFYYDVVLRGKFSDHITELHKIYGEFNVSIET